MTPNAERHRYNSDTASYNSSPSLQHQITLVERKKPPANMTIQVLEAEDGDYPRIFEVSSRSFDRNEHLWDVLYPEHWTPAGRAKGAERMRETNATDKFTTYLKAVEVETGTIVGMAKWNVFDHEMPPDPADQSETQQVKQNHWHSEDEQQYAEAMIAKFVERRNAALKASNGHLVGLDILAIDPDHQRKGVGGALVAWGTKKADEMGCEAVVESSVPGRGLYEKNGFVWLEDVSFEAADRWPGRPPALFAWLVRPKKASS